MTVCGLSGKELQLNCPCPAQKECAMKIEKRRPADNMYPYVFRHRYGTLTIYARDKDEAKARAKLHSRGMFVTEESIHV